MTIYKKCYEDENIKVGDLISYAGGIDDQSVTRSYLEPFKKRYKTVIGICTKILENGNIEVTDIGICDVNVTGIICIGDKLTVSEKAGKACAIKYKEDEYKFDKRCIGKVIGLYNEYDRAKILINIE